jgi:hypothetical protein
MSLCRQYTNTKCSERVYKLIYVKLRLLTIADKKKLELRDAERLVRRR